MQSKNCKKYDAMQVLFKNSYMNYTENEKAIIWLDLFDFLTYKKQISILECFEQPSDMFFQFKSKSDLVKKIVTEEQFAKMEYALNDQYLQKYMIELENRGITVVTFCSEKYPKQFLNFDEKPIILYCKGDLSLLNKKSVGVVGTRKPTRYGKDVTERFARQLASAGMTIISGLADGVDMIAHQSALDVGGKTIAVMGSGFDCIYPKTNFELERKIEKLGLVMTEYRPNVEPAVWHYPFRNRIIAGLSDAVLITEASTKSGALYTRDYCIDYGIDLYAIPGEITNFQSGGTNGILKACQASLVTSPDDILENLNIKNNYEPIVANLQLTFEEQLILNTINGETHFDEILNSTKIDTKTLLTLLTEMELNGIIKKIAGNYYAKC